MSVIVFELYKLNLNAVIYTVDCVEENVKNGALKKRSMHQEQFLFKS
ncbi:hypothetical protein N482_24730 [Pseudoalteromonas luteoviolacea NCIMB 1942]|uniref:Uncharacterized protein n=1 Tax=Pseudoalteromonas luteoviolacea NCIMB 1942 TaxID=1365253 RepID=A0A161YA65_9GAMM|nr:hypothetical protein N482_24730 [Pseudoalteromonas luteoviolacea NCIMB 1942]